jgi:hypothetical protein
MLTKEGPNIDVRYDLKEVAQKIKLLRNELTTIHNKQTP